VISATSSGQTGQITVQVVAVDNVQSVTLQLTSVVVNGTCEEDSIFEDDIDGEFRFIFEFRRDGGSTTIWSVGPTPYTKGSHPVAQSATFNRNVTRGEDFAVWFTATEFDGILGEDSKLNGTFAGRVYTYQSGQWTPTSRSLTVGTGSCGATVNYTITSDTP